MKISLPQLRALMIFYILGIGLICIPQLSAAYGRGGMTAVFAGGILALLAALLLNGIKINSGVLYGLFFVRTAVLAAMLLRIFAELVTAVLLPGASLFAVAAVGMLSAFYGAYNGRGAVRSAQLLMPPALLLVVFCVFISARNAAFDTLLPLAALPLPKLMAVAALTLAMLLPPEPLALAGDTCKKAAFMPAVLAGGLPVLAAAVVWQLRFNMPTAFPILDLTYSGDLSAAFARDQEGLLLFVMIASCFFLLCLSVIFCAGILRKYCGVKKGVIPSALLIFVCSMLPDSLENAKRILYVALVAGTLLVLLALAAKYLKKVGFFILLLLLLTACTGREPEQRDHALSMFVGKDGVSLGIARLEKGDSTAGFDICSAKGDTIAQALDRINADRGGAVYMGQLMLCVIETSCLDEDNLKALTSLFLDDDNLSRGVAVLAAEDIGVFTDGSCDIVDFARQYYRSDNVCRQDIDRLMHTLAETGGDAMLPFAAVEDGIKADGCAVVKHYSYAGRMTHENFEWLLWAMRGTGAYNVLKCDDAVVGLERKSVKRTYKNGFLLHIKAEGRLLQGSTAFDKKQAEMLLAQNVRSALLLLQNTYKSDCLEIAAEYGRKVKKLPFGDIPVKVEATIEWRDTI